jgi:hypothetical protein
MARVPDEFRNEFSQKGDTFFQIAELLYTHPSRQYTQDELAEKVNRSKTTVSNHISDMDEGEWLTRRENQTTFAWNEEAHNPASTEGMTAVKTFYLDFWSLLKKHSSTAPGAFAVVGFSFILAAAVVFAFFMGVSLRIVQTSSVPTMLYFALAFGSFLAGVVLTFISPLQALVNRFLWRLLPDNIFQEK